MSNDEAERAAGSCLMVGFEGPDLSAAERSALLSLRPRGAILFRRNLDSPGRLAALLAELERLLPAPFLLAVDQEGGRVSRLEPWVGATPSAARLARAGEGALGQVAHATAGALAALGFNLDLAPVVDLVPSAEGDAIGDRSFGGDPEEVARLAGAFLDALQRRGVAGCLKHFPGLGRTPVDSHESRPRFNRPLELIEREDLLPYRRLAPRAAAVLVGHGSYPALDPEHPETPASLSAAIVAGLLRGKLGFRGLVVTDDLEMGALREREAPDGTGAAAIAAGCDLLLHCRDLERARRSKEAIVTRATREPAFAARLERAAGAVEAFAARWPRRPTDLVAWSRARERLVEAAALA